MLKSVELLFAKAFVIINILASVFVFSLKKIKTFILCVVKDVNLADF